MSVCDCGSKKYSKLPNLNQDNNPAVIVVYAEQSSPECCLVFNEDVFGKDLGILTLQEKLSRGFKRKLRL